MTNTEIMDAAKVFARTHLRACCEDLMVLNETGVVPPDGRFRHLEAMVRPVATNSAMAVATTLVNSAAREFVLANT